MMSKATQRFTDVINMAGGIALALVLLLIDCFAPSVIASHSAKLVPVVTIQLSKARPVPKRYELLADIIRSKNRMMTRIA